MHVGSGRRVVVQGLDNCIVVEKDDALLICRMSDEQRIGSSASQIVAPRRRPLLSFSCLTLIHSMNKTTLPLFALALLPAGMAARDGVRTLPTSGARPNVLVIMTDDVATATSPATGRTG